MFKSKNILLLVTIFTTTLLFNGCSHKEEIHTNHGHWGYTGESSPKNWGDLDEKFSMCKNGKQQSPINIENYTNEKENKLLINYNTNAKDIINNGHTVQVNVNDGSSLTLDGTKYALKQFHFHTPSENNIMGNSYDLEAHFVHASEDGHLAVIGVMFKEGKQNAQLAKIWSQLPKDEGKNEAITFNQKDINALLPTEQSYYHFMGSLTTPPCSEDVKWYIMKKTLEISKEQVKTFFDLYGHSNNRPIQPTNGRKIKG